MSIRHILVPTDFSDHSETAVELAANLAKGRKSRITILHIDPIPGFAALSVEPMYVPPQVFERFRRGHDQQLEKALVDAQSDMPAEVSATTSVRRSDPVEGIIDFAQESEVDLIVMGSHGRGATRFLLGSVAEKVSRAAPCPVLVTRAGMPAHERGGFDRVLVGIDYSRFAVPAVRLANDLLAAGGKLDLGHIWNAPHASLLDAALLDAAELARATEDGRAHEANTLADFAAELDLPGTPGIWIGTGSIPGALLGRASEIGADLIAVGAHSREHLSERIIGTNADRILRHSETPVLLVPDAAIQRPS